MNPASAAVTAASTLVWGPYTAALFVDPGAFDALYNSRPPLASDAAEAASGNDTPFAIYNEVRPALTLLFPQIEEKGFNRFGLRRKFEAAEENKRDAGLFLDTFGKSLAVFGEDHPEGYREALKAAVTDDPLSTLNVTAGNLGAFVRLTNWKARKERELFWKGAGVERERNERAWAIATTALSSGVSAVGGGSLAVGYYFPNPSFWLGIVAGGLIIFGVAAIAFRTNRLRRAFNDLSKLTREVVSPEVSPVFPEFLPAESRRDPDVVGKLFSGQLKHWIHASLRGSASAR